MSVRKLEKLPETGFVRINDFLPFIGIGRSTVWLWVKEKRFPQPQRISTRCTVWKAEDIHKWLGNTAA